MENNQPFGPEHYVSALRWKAGEIRAYRHLAKAGLTSGVTPLFIVDNYAERAQHENVKKQRIPSEPVPYIVKMASELQKTIQMERAFVDTTLFDQAQKEQEKPLDGLVTLFDQSLIRLSAAVPVVRLTDTVSRREQLRDVVTNGRGAALRLPANAIDKGAEITALLKDLQLRRDNVDLIVDLGYVKDGSLYDGKSELFAELAKLLAGEPRWRTFTVLAGTYPKTIPKGMGPHHYVRHDLRAYQRLRAAFKRQRLRLPSFGDYAIINPEAKPTSGTGAGGGSWPLIRYCTADSWVIWKAVRAAKRGEPSPYLELARACAQHPLFMGPKFSDGDLYIDLRAIAEKTSGGNSTSYIQNDVNHHVALTRAQLNGGIPSPTPRRPDEVKIPDIFATDDDELEDLD